MAEDQDDTSLPVRLIQHPTGSDRLLIYQSGQGARVEFRFDADTLWLTEAEIGDLFGVTRQNINLHLNNIYQEGELDRSATCKYFLQVRHEGNREVRRKALLHDLNAIISVGYRVNSKQGTLFRRWATDKLVQFATKGFVIDVERLESQAEQQRLTTLEQFLAKMRDLIKLDGRPLIPAGHRGSRSKLEADRKAAVEIAALKDRVRLEKEAQGERALGELAEQMRTLPRAGPKRKPQGHA